MKLIPLDEFDSAQQEKPKRGKLKLVPLDEFDSTQQENKKGLSDQKRLSFGESLSRGVDLAQSMGGGFLEATGEAVGFGPLSQFGRDIRERNIEEAQAHGPRSKVAEIESFGDFGQWAKETLGEQIPLMAPSIAGGLTGAVAGAKRGPVGATVGGVLGAAIPSFVMGVGEVQSSIKEKDPEAKAPGAAFVGGSAIAALDSVIPGKVGTKLTKTLGVDMGEQVARKMLTKPVKNEWLKKGAKGTATGMTTEGLTEATQEAVAEVAASMGTDTPIDAEQLKEQMIEAGAAGALLGGGVTGPVEALPSSSKKDDGFRVREDGTMEIDVTPIESELQTRLLNLDKTQANQLAKDLGINARVRQDQTINAIMRNFDEQDIIPALNRIAGETNATQVQRDETQVQEPRSIRQSVQEEGGTDIQRPAQAEPEAGEPQFAREEVPGPERVTYYHTGSFDPSKGDRQKTPAFFTSDKEASESYKDEKQGKTNIFAAKLDINNPATEQDIRDAARVVIENDPDAFPYSEDDLQHVPPSEFIDPESQDAAQSVIDELNLRGFDGAKIPDVRPDGKGQIETVVAFNSDQIKPIQISTKDVDAAAQEAATSPMNDLPEPTQEQIEAGNYKKGHINIQGLDVAIENPVGSVRRGMDKNGRAWQRELQDHYGYVKRTVAPDGDQVDVFLGRNPSSPSVFVIDQIDPRTGKPDEPKVMLGYEDEASAREAYLRNYEEGWGGLGGITELPMDEFKTWLEEGDKSVPLSPDALTPQQTGDKPMFNKAQQYKTVVVREKGTGRVLKRTTATASKPDGQIRLWAKAKFGQGKSVDVEIKSPEKIGSTSGVVKGLKAEKTDAIKKLEDKFRSVGEKYGIENWKSTDISEIQRELLPESLGDALQAFEKVTGTRVHVIRESGKTKIGFQGVTFGDGDLFVTEDSSAPIVTVAAHEFGHNLERTDPELWNYLAEEVSAQGRIPEYREALARAEKDKQVDEDVAIRELTSDAIGDALSDPEFLETLAQRNPSRFRAMADKFIAFLNKLLNKVNLGSNKYLTDVQRFRDKLTEVMEEYVTRGESAINIEPDLPDFQAVFHGTPHKFNRFSLDAIGTGEGAQAYGWGLYFAGKREVAEYYRDALAGADNYDLVEKDGSVFNPEGASMESLAAVYLKSSGDFDKAEEEILELASASPRYEQKYKEAVDALNAMRERGVTPTRNPGNIYQADIPEDRELLDWDKPLSEQPERVKKAIEPIFQRLVRKDGYEPEGDIFKTALAEDPARNGRWLYTELAQENVGKRGFGKDHARAASHALNEAGIPGLRYADNTSRNVVGGEIIGVWQGEQRRMDEKPTGKWFARIKNDAGSKTSMPLGSKKEAEEWAKSQLENISYNYVIWDEDRITVEAVNDELRQAEEQAEVDFSLAKTETSPAFFDYPPEKIDSIIDEYGNKPVYAVRMPIDDYLRLTTVDDRQAGEIRDEGPKTSNLPPFDQVNRDTFDPAEVDRNDVLNAVVTLDVTEDGEVTGHEGRHRSAMAQRDGAKSVPVLIRVQDAPANAPAPTQLSPQFDEASADFMGGRFRPAAETVATPESVLVRSKNRDQIERLVGESSSEIDFQTDTQEFKRWFGDSKVVDENGEPLVVYHGTRGDIQTFDKSKIRPGDYDAPLNGFWFSSDQNTSPSMVDPTNIMPVYVRLENPAPWDLILKMVKTVHKEFRKNGEKALRKESRSVDDEVRHRLQDEGYDGFFFHHPIKLTDEQKKTLEETGEVKVETVRGEIQTLRKREVDKIDFGDIEYERDVYTIEKGGYRREFPNSTYLIKEIKEIIDLETLLDGTLPKEVLQKLGEVTDIKDGETIEVAGFTISREKVKDTYKGLKPTGEKEQVVSLYQLDDEEYSIGHIYDYESVEDYEDWHSEYTPVVFEPTQIKSAIGNRGTFDPNDPRIDFSRKQPEEQQELFESDLSVNDNVWWALRAAAQDKLIDLKRMQQKVGGNKQIQDSMDAYMAEELFHGRAEAASAEFEETMLDPLLDAIRKSDYSIEEIQDYLYARHAPEANKKLQEINPDKESMSGMSNKEAAGILSALHRKGDFKGLEKIGDMVDQITQSRRDLLVSSGLESQDVIDSWEEAYNHYVPLKGRPGEGKDLTPRTGKGYESRGPDSKRRLGRQSRASNILANLVADYNSTIVRAEKAKVGRAMLNFARENADENFWTINKPDQIRRLNPKTGLVESVGDPRHIGKPNVLAVRVDGEDHYITFNEENPIAMRLARAMVNLGVNDSNVLTRAGMKINRFLAAVNTSYNPEFIVSNFLRDVQTATINLNDTEANELKAKVIAGIPSSIRAIRQHQKGTRDNEMAQWYDEFKKEGAKTGWIDHYKDIDDLNKDLMKRLDLMNPGTIQFARRAAKNTIEFIENWNTAVENGVRLSAYIQARKAGINKARAASLAKNLTVNFNRRGSYSNGINALYLFYNASVQGSTRILQAMIRSKKARQWAYGAIAVGAMLDVANRMIGGDDEEGEKRYDSKVPPWVKQMNWIFMLPSGEEMPDWVPEWARGDGYIKIPMPYGYNVLNLLGQKVGKAIDYGRGEVGEFKPFQEALHLGLSVLDAFNPIGGSPTVTQLVSPTVTDPMIQWAENKNFAGIPLRPTGNPFDKTPPPAYQQHFSGAREYSKEIAEFLNDVSGGNEVRPGKIDISPELIDHLIDFTGGGLGRTLGNALDTPATISSFVKGTEELDPNSLPFIRRIIGKDAEYASQQAYYERREHILYAQEELESARGAKDEDLYRDRLKKYKKLRPMFLRVKAAEKMLRNIRKQEKSVRANPRISEDEAKRRLLELSNRKQEVFKQFNRRYADVVYD